MSHYDEVYARWQADPEDFWAEAAEALDWEKKWDHVLDSSNAPFYQWFTGGVLNVCYNALDRHVEGGRADQPALIYDSPVTETVQSYTYRELRDLVARFAGALRAISVGKGDRVIIYMPMVPESAIAMLACARIGAIHSVVFGGFAPAELAKRIEDAKPKVVVAGSCGIEGTRVIPYKPMLDAAIELVKPASRPERCILLQRAQSVADLQAPRDIAWADAMAMAEPAPCVPVAATDPLYILYTSGTTGTPKGVVHDNGGYATALTWSMSNIYGVDPGEVFWAASDVGWAVGHSYIVYAPLLHGATAILFEGKPVGTPDPGTFWRVIAEHKVKVLFTAPTAFRAIKREDPKGDYLKGKDLSAFRALFLAGERTDPDTLHWAEDMLQRPVIDHWWQTETGWPAAANCIGLGALPVKPGSPSKAVPGYDIHVLDEEGGEARPGHIGAIVLKLPLPPGCLPTLWQNDVGFVESYLARYPGAYLTGDAGYLDEDGYLFIMSRTDDIINVAGHRLSTGGMEEVLAEHPDVAECAVFGVGDELKGQVPLGLLVLKVGIEREDDQIIRETIAMVRERIGAVAAFKIACVVKRLPKTRSGKILRGSMQKIADGEAFETPATIDDPEILSEISVVLEKVGYPKEKKRRGKR